jgi:hypothetical protein
MTACGTNDETAKAAAENAAPTTEYENDAEKTSESDKVDTADKTSETSDAETEVTETPTEEVVEVVEEPAEPAFVPDTSIEAIQQFAGLKATVEEDITIGYVDTRIDPSEGNPYDITWDYGELYDKYVSACDWSLIFDIDYYKNTFPMLAIQYNNNDELLLKHFQTVGIHEGRQGSENFNIAAYTLNYIDEHTDDPFDMDYACYAFYYMLNHDTEQNLNTITTNGGDTVPVQNKILVTAFQQQEIDCQNANRNSVFASHTLKFDSETIAYANWQAYRDVTGNTNELSAAEVIEYITLLNKDYDPGTSTYYTNHATFKEECYASCIYSSTYGMDVETLQRMASDDVYYIGISHAYSGINEDNRVVTECFSAYLDKVNNPIE